MVFVFAFTANSYDNGTKTILSSNEHSVAAKQLNLSAILVSSRKLPVGGGRELRNRSVTLRLMMSIIEEMLYCRYNAFRCSGSARNLTVFTRTRTTVVFISFVLRLPSLAKLKSKIFGLQIGSALKPVHHQSGRDTQTLPHLVVLSSPPDDYN